MRGLPGRCRCPRGSGVPGGGDAGPLAGAACGPRDPHLAVAPLEDHGEGAVPDRSPEDKRGKQYERKQNKIQKNYKYKHGKYSNPVFKKWKLKIVSIFKTN